MKLTDKVAELLAFLEPDEVAELDTLIVDDCRDPLQRLLDPEFTATTWEYEHSRTDPFIPGQLHAKQIDALSSEAKHRWLFWGNQVGKTTVGAIDVALLALGRHPYLQRWQPPITAWASALTWELWEKILLPELLTWIPPDRIIDAPEAHKKSTKRDILVRADNGRISRITGKAAEQGADKYQSARVHIVWLDEEHPEAVYDEMQPRLLRHGGVTIATMTPLKGMTWVYSRIYEPWKNKQHDERNVFCSHAGLADNPSVSQESIDALKDELKNNPSQLEARLFGRFMKPVGLILPFNEDEHFSDYTDGELEALCARGSAVCGLDFGLWRFAFILGIADVDGTMHYIDEVFSQQESLEVRGKRIHELLVARHISHDSPIWGDCANPTDIMELNLALMRIKSPYRITGVEFDKKLIRPGIDRTLRLLNKPEGGKPALRVRRGIGSGQTWKLGLNTVRTGTPVEGSRFVWEINNWQYKKDKTEGKAQSDEPDDNTADGADMMAASRYLIMSWWSARPHMVKRNPNEDRSGWQPPKAAERERDTYKSSFTDTSGRARLPGFRVPRPTNREE